MNFRRHQGTSSSGLVIHDLLGNEVKAQKPDLATVAAGGRRRPAGPAAGREARGGGERGPDGRRR